MSRVDARLAGLAEGQEGVFGVWQLPANGVSARAVLTRARDGRLRRLHRGVYALGPKVTPRGWWMAAALAGGPDAVLSHRSAGALHDLIRRPAGPIDITVPGTGRRHRRGLRLHAASLAAADRAMIGPIPVTALPRTFLDLAEVLTEIELRRAYERAERLEILDVRAVAELLDRSNGHRGLRRLRALLTYDPTAAARAESELERLFLDLLRAHGIPMPQVNVLVEGYLVDCFWPEANLVVELDGYEWHRDRDAFERDRRRVTELRRTGREVVQFTYAQVTREPRWVAAAVGDLLARGGAPIAAA